MSDLLSMFKNFLEADEHQMYITGVAGTGKTTSLKELVEFCAQHNISYVVCAYTHKAVDVLRSKLPQGSNIRTLHSYLKKVPTINDQATELHHVDSNTQLAEPDALSIVFIDEFSMIGEKDYNDLFSMEEGKVAKLVFVGDPNQLPPVKDATVIEPTGDYWFKLTKIHRQAGDNPLIDTLVTINAYLDGAKPEPLKEHETFERGFDLPMVYKRYYKTNSCILLAYTNNKVEELNALVEGRTEPLAGDQLFSPTTKNTYTMVSKAPVCIEGYVHAINGHSISLGTTYKTLETLETLEGLEFYTLQDKDANETSRAVIFGHGKYQDFMAKLANEAVKANKNIEKAFNVDAKEWAKDNYMHPLAKLRSLAWRKYMAAKQCVICLDFNHAMTIHKSQGSTYEYVFIDTEDLGRCADKDYTMYLKLLYVAISRASKKVYTN